MFRNSLQHTEIWLQWHTFVIGVTNSKFSVCVITEEFLM